MDDYRGEYGDDSVPIMTIGFESYASLFMFIGMLLIVAKICGSLVEYYFQKQPHLLPERYDQTSSKLLLFIVNTLLVFFVSYIIANSIASWSPILWHNKIAKSHPVLVRWLFVIYSAVFFYHGLKIIGTRWKGQVGLVKIAHKSCLFDNQHSFRWVYIIERDKELSADAIVMNCCCKECRAKFSGALSSTDDLIDRAAMKVILVRRFEQLVKDQERS